MRIIKICKLESCNNKVKLNRDSFCSQQCYWKSLLGHTLNKGKKRTEEQNKRNSEVHKGRKHTKEEIQKQIKAQIGRKFSQETRQKIRESHYGMKVSEETKQKQSKARQGKYFGENNPNWNNGSSFEPYGLEFNKEFKQSVYERDNYKCKCPDCENKTNILDAHHIDFNKQNNILENLITLCRSCHSKTNGKNKRNYWTRFYQNIMINRLIECLL